LLKTFAHPHETSRSSDRKRDICSCVHTYSLNVVLTKILLTQLSMSHTVSFYRPLSVDLGPDLALTPSQDGQESMNLVDYDCRESIIPEDGHVDESSVTFRDGHSASLSGYRRGTSIDSQSELASSYEMELLPPAIGSEPSTSKNPTTYDRRLQSRSAQPHSGFATGP